MQSLLNASVAVHGDLITKEEYVVRGTLLNESVIKVINILNWAGHILCQEGGKAITK